MPVQYLSQNWKRFFYWKTTTSMGNSGFKQAYYIHINAWENAGNIVNDHPYIPEGYGEAILSGFIKGLCGDWTGGLGELIRWNKRHTMAMQEVSRTWQDVKNEAEYHGVKLED